MSEAQVVQCDITPTTDLIYSVRNNGDINLTKALCELTDNSIDADAMTVQIDLDREEGMLTVWDDGRGCVDAEAMFTMGRHVPTSRRTIGRYGIGLKSAAMWLSSVTHILSCNGSDSMALNVDWNDVAASGAWSICATKGLLFSPSFTEIRFRLLEDRCNAQAIRRAKEALADIFSPAIEAGCRIVVDGEPLRAVGLPKLTDVLKHDGTFEGKPYSLTAGLLPAASSRNGYRIAFRHRIIEDGVRRGCGDYNASRFFAYLTLDETDDGPRWQLDGHKHGFSERDRLLEELFPVLESLLQKSHEKSEQIEIAELSHEVEASLASTLNSALSTALRPGTRRKKPGSVKGTGEGSPHVHTEHPGDERGKYRAATRRARNLLRLQFCEFTDAADKIGRVQFGDAGSVWITLNVLHPHVASARDQRDVAVLRQLAATLYIADDLLRGNNHLPFPEMSTHDRFIRILSDALNLPEQTAKEAA